MKGLPVKPELKKDWVPSEGAFRRLSSWLDEGADSGGEKYVEMRRRLAAYFDRRSCLSSDELPDETPNRVARRLEEDGAASDAPARYCYIVARFVFLEYIRRTGHGRVTLDERSGSPTLMAHTQPADSDMATRQGLLDCLERCLQELPARDRELILEYSARRTRSWAPWLLVKHGGSPRSPSAMISRFLASPTAIGRPTRQEG